MTIAILLLHAAAVAAGAQAPCKAPDAPVLDHAIIAVRDLDGAARAFRSAGFMIKAGRLHANGLLNRHIKFPDGTEIELMTVQGEPGDDMARRYARLIESGDGGVYLALKARDLGVVEQAAAKQKLRTRKSSSGPWQFLGFTGDAAAAIFFSAGNTTVADADSIFAHEPRVTSLVEVWLEGGPELGVFLRDIGAVACGSATAPDGRRGERYALGRGSVVVASSRAGMRPRVLGAVLETPARAARTIRPVPQFWIQYR
jgi:hypothetical protein